MRILITGTAGFIGAAVASKLLSFNHEIIGIDNLNDYYDQKLKQDRLNLFINNPSYTHCFFDISNGAEVERIFRTKEPEIVINLAAQAGVRHSINHPESYISSNVVGYANLIQSANKHHVSHFIYASSSSVYGANNTLPYSTSQCTERPLSLYAATKKTNELIAYSYSHLFKMRTTGLRFFTVYGPWGRPDMAIYKFTKAILRGEAIELYNHGLHLRDLTYIEDVVSAVTSIAVNVKLEDRAHTEVGTISEHNNVDYRIYNVGNSNPVKLTDIVECLENILGRAAKKNLVDSQLGDVHQTHADISPLSRDYGYRPQTDMREGLQRFVDWYRGYYSN